MIQEYQIRVLPVVASNEQNIRQFVAEDKGIDVRTINAVRVLKRSIDARQRTIFINLTVRVYINELPQDDEYVSTEYGDVSCKPAVVVVGEGPGGLFSSLRLIELGLRPIVLERGKNVRDRKVDLANIKKTQKVDPESNYCFGEGGAGAYSDGKLYTRSKKRGNIEKILNVFCQHGASTSILADAHPHIGTDKLPKVIENMRETIIRCGGEVHFQTKMTRLIIDGDMVVGVEAVNLITGAEQTYRGPVILATGHSARDVYRYLAEAKIEIEAKGIAVGVRLEHPSHLIDQIQYHSKQGRGKYLPAAEYSFVTQVADRGVYSFCMCPGGFVIPAATDKEQLVVNGMSPSNRGTQWSNSGMVVETRPEADGSSAAYGRFRQWPPVVRPSQEQLCARSDFVTVALLVASSGGQAIAGGIQEVWQDESRISYQRGCNDSHRTSSPVRIVRDRETLQHVRIKGLFPCGEGAGYAGGIVSAGVDGERCAERCAAYMEV